MVKYAYKLEYVPMTSIGSCFVDSIGRKIHGITMWKGNVLPGGIKQEPMEADAADWREVPVVGLVEVKSSERVEEGTRLQDVEINADICSRIEFEEDVVWRVTYTDGTKEILGTPMPPVPLHTIDEVRPASASSEAGYKLKVTSKTQEGLLQQAKLMAR